TERQGRGGGVQGQEEGASVGAGNMSSTSEEGQLGSTSEQVVMPKSVPSQAELLESEAERESLQLSLISLRRTEREVRQRTAAARAQRREAMGLLQQWEQEALRGIELMGVLETMRMQALQVANKRKKAVDRQIAQNAALSRRLSELQSGKKVGNEATVWHQGTGPSSQMDGARAGAWAGARVGAVVGVDLGQGDIGSMGEKGRGMVPGDRCLLKAEE
ncbi:unnamed protein product, partial [Discosporangium mesarthrocarpum]